MCLTREWSKGSSDSVLVAVLSQEIVVGRFCRYPIASSRVRNQIHSLAVSNAAIYSASQEEEATTFCLRAAQEMAPDPSEQTYPPTLRRVSRQLAQSESLNAWSVIGSPPPRCNLRSLVPFR